MFRQTILPALALALAPFLPMAAAATELPVRGVTLSSAGLAQIVRGGTVAPDAGGGQRWQLRAERESLRNPALAAKLAAALADALGEPTQVEVVAGVAHDSVFRRDNHAREAAQQAAEQLIQADPDVRAVMARFRTARIVPGSIKPLAADGGHPKATPP